MRDPFDLADRLVALPEACRHARRLESLHLRDAAAQIGIDFGDLGRFENHKQDVRLSTLVKIARWVDERDRLAEEAWERFNEWVRTKDPAAITRPEVEA